MAYSPTEPHHLKWKVGPTVSRFQVVALEMAVQFCHLPPNEVKNMATSAEINFFGVTVACTHDGYPDNQLPIIIDWWLEYHKIKDVVEGAVWAVIGPELEVYAGYSHVYHPGGANYQYKVNDDGIWVQYYSDKWLMLMSAYEIENESNKLFEGGWLNKEGTEWLEKRLAEIRLYEDDE